MSRIIREVFGKAAEKAATNLEKQVFTKTASNAVTNLEIESSHLKFSFDPDLKWTNRITNTSSVKEDVMLNVDILSEKYLLGQIGDILRYFYWNEVEGTIETTIAQADVRSANHRLGVFTTSIVVYPKPNFPVQFEMFPTEDGRYQITAWTCCKYKQKEPVE